MRDPEQALLNQKQVMRMLAVGSRETLSRWIRQGLFPPPIRIGGGQLRWIRREVDAWIAAKAASRGPKDAPSVEVRKQEHTGRRIAERELRV
ncbi:MAG: helix-turn-helix domain-containing protein [Sphingomonadaceae bacterium]